MNLYPKTYLEIKKGLNQNEFSCLELCESFLERIEKVDKEIKAFLSFDKDKILQQAEQSTIRRKKGQELSVFDGIPIAIKNNICIENEITSCASKFLKNYRSPFSATVIEKLQEKGFVLFSGTNMDEFAMGSTTENSAYQITKNPLDLKRVCGGSSGGSAAAVSASMTPVALGSDTGGSVRMPASFCGIFGLKPTYGRVSRYGLVAYASSLDQIGTLGNDLDSIIDTFEVIAGEDPKDNTSLKNSHFSRQKTENLKQPIIGVMSRSSMKNIDEEVQEKYFKTLDFLRKEKLNLVELDFSFLSYCVPVYYIIACSECSSNLSRFDGVRYGVRQKTDNLEKLYVLSRTKGFGEEVKRRILTGTFALSSGYYEAFYGKAQKARKMICSKYQQFFEKVDLILQPTCTNVAFKIGEKSKDPIQMYQQDILTVGANLAGIPAMSMPIGIGKKSKMPVGLQISARQFGEDKIFSFSKALASYCP